MGYQEIQERVTTELQKCMENIDRDKSGYQRIVCGSEGCHYHCKEFRCPVDNAIAFVWNRTGIVAHHEVTDGKALPDDEGFIAIIKKQKRIVLADKGSGYFASGMAGINEADARNAILYFRCGDIVTFVAASSDMRKIHVVDYVHEVEKLGEDPLQAVLSDLLDCLPRKEATNDAGPEDGGAD